MDTDEYRSIHANIEHLDYLNNSFSRLALELLNKPHEKAIRNVKGWLRSITNQNNLSEANKQAYKVQTRTGRTTTAADYALRSSIIAYSVFSTPDFPAELLAIAQSEVRITDETLQRHHPGVAPDAIEPMIRYYQLLAVVAQHNYLTTGQLSAVNETAAFTQWAMKQEDHHAVLSIVQRTLSLSTVHLEQLLNQQAETPQPLHHGLL